MRCRELLGQGRLGIGLAASIAIAYLALIIAAARAGISLPWLGNLLVCLMLVAASYQLAPLASMAAFWAQRTANAFISLAERAYRCVISAVLLVVTALDYLATLVAGPLIAILQRRTTA